MIDFLTKQVDLNEDDPFELFVAATSIRYCHYRDTHKILGNTYGCLVLQEALKMCSGVRVLDRRQHLHAFDLQLVVRFRHQVA